VFLVCVGEYKVLVAFMRQCARCRRVLPPEEFSPDVRGVDGLRSWCKQCTSEESTLYHARSRARHWSTEKLRRHIEMKRNLIMILREELARREERPES
jgi:hypothetical protein